MTARFVFAILAVPGEANSCARPVKLSHGLGMGRIASDDSKWFGAGLSREEIHDQKRRALVATASRVFREHGFRETSMDDIARLLNVSKTAIYYYVKNKKELFYLCHSLAFDLGEEALEEAQRLGRTARERLELLIRGYVTRLTSELGGGALITSDSALSAKHLAIIRKRRKEWDRAFRDLVEQGMADGSLRHCDARLIEFFVMGAIRSLHRWYSPTGEKSGEQIADELIAMVFGGIQQR